MTEQEQINHLTQRVILLEENVRQILDVVFKPAALAAEHTPNMADAKREVMHELGGTEIDAAPHTPTPRRTRSELEGQMNVEEVIVGEIYEPHHEVDQRALASRRAETLGAVGLTRNFRPSLVGYTATMFREDYPDLDPATVVEQFFNHHLSKGTKSKNWLEEFFKFAGRAQQWANESNAVVSGETDSMGLPVDPAKRREILGHNEREELNATDND